jgi:serine/threonine protein kinase
MITCPGPDALRRLFDDEQLSMAPSAVQTHVESCTLCQQMLERLAAAGPSWDRAARLLGTLDELTGPALGNAVEKLQRVDVSGTGSSGSGSGSGIATPGGQRGAPLAHFPFLEPASGPGQLGRLGHYAILDVVGRGGMGIVFKARDERLQRMVAIKVLGAQYASSSSACKRFEREAKAAAAVSHEHVVPIYSVEEARGISYLVMPLISGKSLQDRIDQHGALELKHVLCIGAQIASGLAAAHKQGLIHRDVKPANILLEGVDGEESGIGEATRFPALRAQLPRVKITDFGLARAVDDASVTQSGVITGTPMFMSPEQARGEYNLDARSDLFSLGSVLYVMATGRAPFRAAGAHAVIHRVINDSPRPMRAINPEVPAWLEAIVAKLHAKHPGDRFASAGEVADLLLQHLAHLHEPARVPRPAAVTPPPSPSRPASNARARASIMVVTLGCAIAFLACAAPTGLALFGLFTKQRHDPGGREVAEELAAAVDLPWVQLFNGINLDGWKRPPKFPGQWQVVDGVLIGKCATLAMLHTERGDLANFHLRVEARINGGGISGVWFRCPAVDAYAGYQSAINATNPFPLKTGSLHRVDPGKNQSLIVYERPLVADNVWFPLEIIADGPRLVLKIDGVIVDRVQDDRFARGHIGLEVRGENSIAEFRKVEIKELR